MSQLMAGKKSRWIYLHEMKVIIIYLVLACLSVLVVSLKEQFVKLSRQRRYLTIPSGSAIGLILAFAVPVPDLPDQDLLFSWNLEANYNLPDELYYFGTAPAIPDLNQDPDLEDPVRRSLRSVTRIRVYELLQRRLQNLGFHGRACLLQMICETGQTSFDPNGLMGHLLQALLTPSLNKFEDISQEYLDAEASGLRGEDCIQLFPDCPQSIINSFANY